MADYFDVDPVIMRIIWVAAGVLTGGLAIPAYIVMWLIMPRDDQGGEAWRAPGAPSGVAEPGGPPHQAWGASERDAWGATPRQTSWGGPSHEPAGETPVETAGGSVSEGPAEQPVYATVGSPSAGEGAPAEASASQPSPGRGLTPEEEELLRPITPPPSQVHMVDEVGRRRRAAGVLLVGLGAVFFAQQLGLVVHIPWHVLWPLAIVGVGIFILTRQGAGRRR